VLRLALRADGYDWAFLPVAGAGYGDGGSGACVPAAGGRQADDAGGGRSVSSGDVAYVVAHIAKMYGSRETATRWRTVFSSN